MAGSRRDFIKQTGAAALAAGMPASALGQNVITEAEAAKLKWS